MEYEEKLQKITDNEFFDFFAAMHAEPRWVTSAGHKSIQILGLCHCGSNHSVVFDPNTLKMTCFSLCGTGMLLHTWVKKVLKTDNPQEAKDFIEDWIDGKKINFSERIGRDIDDFVYEERPFIPEHIDPLLGIEKDTIEKLYSHFDTRPETLERLVWHTRDGIDVEQLIRFQVAHYPDEKHDTIILPHHNINGEIVGLYERNFRPLRKVMQKECPDAPYSFICQFPRAKYYPLPKEGEFYDENSEKTSWSFPNNRNLYGLHLAKDAIKETGKVIVFEGAKSVMLAHQYGYPFAVASHTFGMSENHASMLIECGAKEIIFAFDKQYENKDEDDKQWILYKKKTYEFAEKIGKYVDVSLIIDNEDLIGYKDAPIDKGKDIFIQLYNNRQFLIQNGEKIIQKEEKSVKSKIDFPCRPKVHHEDPIMMNKEGTGEIFIYV